MNRNTYPQICLITLTLLIAGAILAAPALALKVEGARIALDVEPGKTYTSPIGISISSEESGGTYAVDVMGFGQSTADGTYSALEAAKDASQYSARPFITIDKPTVSLKPGERAAITATINIPSEARDGGRYAIIMVHPASSTAGAPAAFATAVAIPVLLTVKGGTVTETGEISALEPAFTEPGKPFQVITTFRNTGNHHYYGVVSNVTITDAQGKVVAKVSSKPFEKALVPGQPVKFTSTIGTGLTQGTYQVTFRIQTQDGELLAEKKGTLQVGTPASLQETQAQVTPTQTTPGFGALVAVVALSVVFLVAFRFRKGGK